LWALTYMNPHVIKDVYVVITGRVFWEVVDVNVDVNTKFEAVVPLVTVDVVDVVTTGRICWEVVDVNVDAISNFEVVVLLLVTVDVVDVVITGRVCWEVVDVNVDEIPIIGLLVTKNPKKRQFVSDRPRESRTEREDRKRSDSES
jgi:hypothetical protein